MSKLKLFDEYVSDKKAFRKAIRNCQNFKELFFFLKEIAEAHLFLRANFRYQLFCENRWGLPISDIEITSNKIICLFDTRGMRKFKTISDFSYHVYLKKSEWGRSFGISIEE